MQARCCRAADCPVHGGGEHAERERLSAASPKGGGGQRAYRSVRVERAAAAALGGGREGEDGRIVCEEIVGRCGVISGWAGGAGGTAG